MRPGSGSPGFSSKTVSPRTAKKPWRSRSTWIPTRRTERGTATRLVRRHVTLRLWHHDRASLLGGKLHAVLRRPFAKGRDVYDLGWYLSDPQWPAPNLELLNHALRQSDEGDVSMTEDAWTTTVARRLEELAWERLTADVAPFLEGSETMPRRDDLLALLDR